MDITYRSDVTPGYEQVIELYRNACLPRPVDDPARITKMYENSNLIVTAWHNNKLVGVSRTITDWAWSSYLADLAVNPGYQQLGIGKRLIDITREKLGEQAMILLLSVPTAMDYYPKVGFKKEDRAFMLPRSQ